mmetsp:Transcript_19009/g.36781  ORF Transcript_19009/g.36781 Transcript_19009/m.36781 type:complete len:1042 (-) Transcript_19009:140-3265(-)
MLGLNDRVVEIRGRSWSERIELLTKRGKWIHGLALALDFYEHKAKAPLGLPSDSKQKQRALMTKCEALLLAYTDLALGQFLAKSSKQGAAGKGGNAQLSMKNLGQEIATRGRRLTEEAPHFRVVGAVTVDFCLVLNRPEMLFGRIWPVFCRAGGADVLLDLLQPFILNDRLKSLPKQVFQLMVKHYINTNRHNDLEQIILHLDVNSMDSSQILALSQEYGLYEAIIHAHITKKPKANFAAPIRTMYLAISAPETTKLQTAQKTRLPPKYLILLYAKRCMEGRRYPSLIIDGQKQQALAIAQVLSVIFERRPFSPQTAASHMDSNQSQEVMLMDRDNYPILRHLGEQDLAQMLKVLDKAFQNSPKWVHLQGSKQERAARRRSATASSSSGKSGKANPPAPTETKALAAAGGGEGGTGGRRKGYHRLFGARDYVPSCEEMAELLVGIFGSDQENQEEMYCHVHLFCAKHIAEGVLMDDPQIMTKALGLLLSNGPETKKDDDASKKNHNKHLLRSREEILLMLLAKMPKDMYDTDSMMEKCLACGFHQARVFLLKQKGDYKQMVSGYLLDPSSHRKKVFSFIRSVLEGQGNNVTKQDQDQMRKAVMTQISNLVECDQFQAARLVIDFFSDNPDLVVSRLSSHPELQYRILRQIMLHRGTRNKQQKGGLGDDRGSGGKDGNAVFDENDVARHSSSRMAAGHTDALLEQSGLSLSDDLHRIYIRLLARFDPKAVYPHLTRYHDYDIDQILELCQEHKINDATAYLLERVGDVHGALTLTLNQMETVDMVQLRNTLQHSKYLVVDPLTYPVDKIPQYQKVMRILIIACNRCSGTVNNHELWFNLLDRIIRFKTEDGGFSSKSGGGQLYRRIVKDMVKATLKEMLKDIELETILTRIFDKYANHELQDFRHAIREILDTSEHETSVRETASRLQQIDIFHTMAEHVLTLSKASSRLQTINSDGKAVTGRQSHRARKQRLWKWTAMERTAAAKAAAPSRHTSTAKHKRKQSSAMSLHLAPIKPRPDRREFRPSAKGMLRKELTLDFKRL